MTAGPLSRGRPPAGSHGGRAGARRQGAGRHRGRRPAEQGGQAAAELALVLPFVVVLLLAVVQVALVAADQVLVVHAAREGAREAAVNHDQGGPRRAALAGSGLDHSRLTVGTVAPEGRHGMVVVTVSYQAATRVPLVGALLPDVTLGAKAAMRSEL